MYIKYIRSQTVTSAIRKNRTGKRERMVSRSCSFKEGGTKKASSPR